MEIDNGFVQQYEPVIRAIAANEQQSHECLDDLCQDAWIGVLTAPEPHTSLDAALAYAARNGIRDARRQRDGDTRTEIGSTKRYGLEHTSLYGTDPNPEPHTL